MRAPIPRRPVQLERYECEYKRNGAAKLFVVLDVHRPWRKVKVTASRTALDFAACMRDLADVHFPKLRASASSSITLSAGALYQLRRLEFHYVPKKCQLVDGRSLSRKKEVAGHPSLRGPQLAQRPTLLEA